MQSESQGHDGHEAHDATAASTENIRSGLVFGWGLGMFIAVLLCIGGLTGYFWSTRGDHFRAKVGERNSFGTTAAELSTVEQGRLKGYKKLSDTRVQIPIEDAMKKVVEEGL